MSKKLVQTEIWTQDLRLAVQMLHQLSYQDALN